MAWARSSWERKWAFMGLSGSHNQTAIALGPNGMKALGRLGVYEALDDELAFRNCSGYPMVYSRFYRAHLQQALVTHVKPETIHLRKAFQSVESLPDTDELLISFTDESTTTADVLLGADGIQSAVRRSFVPSSAPKWTGWVAFRSVFDAKLVEHIPGVLDEAYHWWGPDRTFFSSKLGKNQFTIVGGNYTDPNAPDAPFKDATWNSDGDLAVFKEYYKDWHPAIRQMIDASPYTRLYPNTFASSLDTWVHGNGQVTYAGDAAHAHGGAFAAGGSLALDDAWAFSRAILTAYPPGSPKPSKAVITQALRLYEATRKPHTDRVLSTVHANNENAIKRLGQVENDEQLRERMKKRADPFWIHEHEVDKVFDQVLAENTQTSQARL
ncbi:hypothetical protein PRZ48_012808 [Zasmidium cellare]|uniref:Monooxygenase n=1 Tax=Zasmidium cellare TaxID=395010 RepID=A0ABR0E5Z1_ZASCE|nr:hypothetical protein PRZ48_012808 [Zasmidium cellare]